MKIKISLVLVVLIILLLTLTGCGKKEETNNPSTLVQEENKRNTLNEPISTGDSDFDNSKIKKYYVDRIGTGDYYMKMKASFEGIDSTMESSKKGDKIANYVVEQNMTIIQDNNVTYTIDHNEKTIYTIPSEVASSTGIPTTEEITKEANVKITSGKETLNGIEYDYEEIQGAKYYFLNNEVKYLKAEGEVIEILEISSTPKDSLFEMPSDYIKMID